MSLRRFSSFFLQHQWILAGCFFTASLLYFMFGTGWYEPGRLVIKGNAVSMDAVVDVQWDSGAGYNGYEREQFQFLSTQGGDDKDHLLVLRRVPQDKPGREKNRVVLYEIRSDDKGVPVPASALHEVGKVQGSGWVFDSDESELHLRVPAEERLYLLLQSNTRSGIVQLFIDGQEIRHELYQRNWEIQLARLNFWFLDDDGNFTVSFDMPRYSVASLRVLLPDQAAVTSLTVQTTGRSIDLPFTVQENGAVVVSRPNRSLKQFFHPTQFAFQLLFSLLLTGLFLMVGRRLAACSSLRQIFSADGRWVFWAFFSGALFVYSLWLLAFWPGVMSVDSLNIWRAAWLPDVMINNHPFLNVLWYMFLLHLWNNIAVVPLSQIFLFSLLLATVLFFCFRQGVRLQLLLPCFFLAVFSVPVGLYTITLWKDVPFALLVVCWSLIPAYFFYRKKRGEPVRLQPGSVAVLLLLFLALLLFRHNGMVYLVVIPVLFVVLQLVRIPKTLVVIGGAGIVCLLLVVLFPPRAINGASYFHDLSLKYLQQVMHESPLQRVTKAAVQYPRLLDLKKNKEESDFWHYYLGDRYAYTFLRDVGWSDAFPYRAPDRHVFPALREFGLYLYNQSLEYPWIYFTWNPFWLLYLFPLSILLGRWFPLSAVFSAVILTQILALLVFVGTVNWRYYYFVLVGGYLLLPVALLDWHCRMTKKQRAES